MHTKPTALWRAYSAQCTAIVTILKLRIRIVQERLLKSHFMLKCRFQLQFSSYKGLDLRSFSFKVTIMEEDILSSTQDFK